LNSVRLWHFSAVPTAPSNVGFREKTRRHMLNASSSQFDPQRSFENSALDAFRLEDHVNCEDNRATRAPAGVPGGRLQRRTE
jgi:hypothetical protein